MLSVLTAPSRLADQVSDNIALSVIKNSKTGSNIAYNSVTKIPTYGQFIQLFCITYNSILSPENKTLLDNFINNNFSTYKIKYKILTTLCMNETNGEKILKLIKAQLDNENIKSFLTAIGLSVETIKTSTIDSLRREINVRFPKVLDYINNKKSDLTTAFISIDINKIKELATSSSTPSKPVGGKSRKCKKRSNKTKKRKTKSRHRK